MDWLRRGQKIKLELHHDGMPRWRYEKYIFVDKGYTGIMKHGEVTQTTFDTFTVAYEWNGSLNEYVFAREKHALFAKDQWKLPGFVSPLISIPTKLSCSCGSHSVYGVGNGAHSHWCDYLK